MMSRLYFVGRSVDVGFMLMFLRLCFGNRSLSDVSVGEIRHVFDLVYKDKLVYIY